MGTGTADLTEHVAHMLLPGNKSSPRAFTACLSPAFSLPVFCLFSIKAIKTPSPKKQLSEDCKETNLQCRRKVGLLHLGQDLRYLLVPPICTTHTANLLDWEWEGLSACQDL